MGTRFLTATFHHRHLGSLRRVPTHRRVYDAVTFDLAQRQGQVMPLDAARLQLAHQIGLRRKRLCHHQQAAGVLVQAMHDAGARNIGQGRRVMQQSIQQGTGRLAVARMHHQAGRLVDHDDSSSSCTMSNSMSSAAIVADPLVFR
jgi:hypothetical protein